MWRLGAVLCILSLVTLIHPAWATWEIFRTSVTDYANELSSALKGFDSQVSNTLTTYEDADIARAFAAQIRFAVTDPETKAFISKWKVAAGEARRLESRAQDLEEEVKAFINYVGKELALINDTRIREVMSRDLSLRKTEFARLMLTAESGMKELRTAIQAGDDLVRAIEIQTAFSILDNRMIEVTDLSRSAIAQAASLRVIAQDGLRILDEMRAFHGTTADKSN